MPVLAAQGIKRKIDTSCDSNAAKRLKQEDLCDALASLCDGIIGCKIKKVAPPTVNLVASEFSTFALCACQDICCLSCTVSLLNRLGDLYLLDVSPSVQVQGSTVKEVQSLKDFHDVSPAMRNTHHDMKKVLQDMKNVSAGMMDSSVLNAPTVPTTSGGCQSLTLQDGSLFKLDFS